MSFSLFLFSYLIILKSAGYFVCHDILSLKKFDVSLMILHFSLRSNSGPGKHVKVRRLEILFEIPWNYLFDSFLAHFLKIGDFVKLQSCFFIWESN